MHVTKNTNTSHVQFSEQSKKSIYETLHFAHVKCTKIQVNKILKKCFDI